MIKDDQDAPRQVVRLWPDPQNGPLRVRVWFGRVQGRPAVVGVEMWGVEPIQAAMPLDSATLDDSPIRAEDIRLPLGKWLDAWTEMQYRYARASRELWGDIPGHEDRVSKFEARIGDKRLGRPALSDEMLSRVTEVYNAAVKDGDRRPAMRVFEVLGADFGASVPETARGWVRQARKRGFPVMDVVRKARTR